MRFACLLIVLAACGGPITPPYATPSRAPGEPDPRVLRPPANAPPDPIGTTRPGNRSCTENRDCKVGETCFAPDYVPPVAAGGVRGGVPMSSPVPGTAGTGAGMADNRAAGNGAGMADNRTAGNGAPASGPAGNGPAGSGPAGNAVAGTTVAPGPGSAAARGVAPGTPVTGSVPAGSPPLQCQGDAQCTPGLICALGACVPPCVEGSCGPGLECRNGGRCMPIACNAPQAPVCPQNFRCGGSGACERQACTSRAQCDSGVCFQGRCFAHDAYCMPPNSTAPQ